MSGERRARLVSAIAGSSTWIARPCRSCLRRATWTPYRRETGIATVLDAHRRGSSSGHPGQLLGAHPTPGTAQPAGLRGQLRNRQARGLRPLRAEASLAGLTQRRFERVGRTSPDRLGPGHRIVRRTAQQVHIFVMTLGCNTPGLRRRLHERAHSDLLAAAQAGPSPASVAAAEFLLYDRMRTVVLGTTTDEHGERKAKFNATFAAFADHWGFTPRLCRPYRAQTKGKVESGVKYVQTQLRPRPQPLPTSTTSIGNWRSGRSRLPNPSDPWHNPPATDRPLCRRSGRTGARAARRFLGHGPLPGRRRRLAGVDRRQPLLGTFRSDRPVRRGRSCRRPLADPLPSRATGRRTSGTGGPRTQLSVCQNTVPAPPRATSGNASRPVCRGTASRRSGSA